jgi:hypothetical protein
MTSTITMALIGNVREVGEVCLWLLHPEVESPCPTRIGSPNTT